MSAIATPQVTDDAFTLDEGWASWVRSLRADNKSPRTIQSYGEALQRLHAFLAERGIPQVVAHIKREHVEEFVADLLSKHKPATAVNRYKSLATFFKWCVEEGEIAGSPMARMHPPQIPEQPVPVLTETEVERLFRATEGRTFDARRNRALLSVFVDTGCRLAEVAGLRIEDVDFENALLWVVGKGNRPRACPMGRVTALDLDRYLRVRAQHRDAADAALWLGLRGPMTDNGIANVVRQLGKRAQIVGMHPHLLRHRFAHDWLAGGGREGDLMRLAGWRSRSMLQRYGASAADERARDEHRSRSAVDRIRRARS